MININLNNIKLEFFRSELNEINNKSKNNVKEIFANALEGVDDNHCCIFLTGSDGRLEKIGKQSPYELIVVFRAGINDEDKAELVTKIKEIAASQIQEFDQEIEFKEVNDGTVLSYKQAVIPTRAFDALKIWGNKEIKKEYLSELFEKMKICGGSTYKKFSKQFRQCAIRQLTHTLKAGDKEAQHFDIPKGELIYDGRNNRATKFPCLRSMQYHLAHIIFKGIKDKKISFEMMEEIRKARTIPNRIECLVNLGLIKETPEKMRLIQEAYEKSLYWYELSQANYDPIENKTIRLAVDAEELRSVANTIYTFVNK